MPELSIYDNAIGVDNTTPTLSLPNGGDGISVQLSSVLKEIRNNTIGTNIGDGIELVLNAAGADVAKNLIFSNQGTDLATSFNDLGQILVRLEFTDGTYGNFISNVGAIPEPHNLAIAWCAVICVGMICRPLRHRLHVP